MNTGTRGEEPNIQLVAVWRVMPGALIVLGRSSSPLPKAGSARVGSLPGALGVFRLDFWSLDPGYAFLAAIRLPERADPPDFAEILLRGARAADRDLVLRLQGATETSEFARLLSFMAQHHAAAVARFLIDLLRPEERESSNSCNPLLEQFLAHAAKPDGCIELILSVPTHCVVLQGWGTLPAEPAELVTVQPTPARVALQLGWFDRDDINAPATGNVLVLPAETIGSVAGCKTIYLLSGSELLSRTLIDPVPMEPDASLGQLRHLLPRLRCSPTLNIALRGALQPRFDGRDTLNSGNRPVRAALDLAAGTEDAGLYLAGWLFDPTAQVASIDVCTNDAVVRLDDRFARIPRPDVSEAFRSDPALPAPRGGHEWGFAAEIPIPLGGSAAHLRITFVGDDVAFMPIRITDAATPAVRHALVTSVDIHKASGVAVVEHHLAPFLARLNQPAATARIVVEGPLDRPHAVVVPLAFVAPPRALIASLLQDTADADEQLIFVCGSGWEQTTLLRLADLVRFYELPASVLVSADMAGPSSALQTAALLSTAEDFLLVSPEAVSPHRGWRRVLRRRAAGADVACPTLLYEDGAIRFAGSSSAMVMERAPYVRMSVAQAGLPAAKERADLPMPMTGGSLACALFRRNALAALTGVARFCTAPVQEAASFRALQDAGMRLAWLPMLHVVAPDTDGEASPVARLIDGWMFRANSAEDRACAS